MPTLGGLTRIFSRARGRSRPGIGGVSAGGTVSAAPARRRGDWWFLLPILMGIQGGLIAFFVIRSDNSKKARNCLYLGAALTAIGAAMSFVIQFVVERFLMDEISIIVQSLS